MLNVLCNLKVLLLLFWNFKLLLILCEIDKNSFMVLVTLGRQRISLCGLVDISMWLSKCIAASQILETLSLIHF